MNLVELAKQVAAKLTANSHLGSEWTVKTFNDVNVVDSDNQWRAILVGPDEQELFISNTWGGKNRIYIGGTWPNRVQLQQIRTPERPSITVADTATPERVAKQIATRLLPSYQKLLADVLRQQAEYDQYKQTKGDTVRAVAKIVKGRLGQSDDYTVYTKGLTIEVVSPESIRVKYCDVTLEQLEKIAKAVPELFNPEVQS